MQFSYAVLVFIGLFCIDGEKLKKHGDPITPPKKDKTVSRNLLERLSQNMSEIEKETKTLMADLNEYEHEIEVKGDLEKEIQKDQDSVKNGDVKRVEELNDKLSKLKQEEEKTAESLKTTLIEKKNDEELIDMQNQNLATGKDPNEGVEKLKKAESSKKADLSKKNRFEQKSRFEQKNRFEQKSRFEQKNRFEQKSRFDKKRRISKNSYSG
eukprot:GHVL01010758.1.p1 GENE.GHVL01010758.1~~GHVL01010758.1.p1  ORF type:complete len:211 (+),score=48.19 GHVL01010758.1:116-748(+)